jgi:outer membrane murein-binding lipoprotein Lpp
MKFFKKVVYLYALTMFVNLSSGFGASLNFGGGCSRPWGCRGGWSRPYYYDDGFGFASGAILGGIAGASLAQPQLPPEDPKDAFERRQKKAAINQHSVVSKEIRRISLKIDRLEKDVLRLTSKLKSARPQRKDSILSEIEDKKATIKRLNEKMRQQKSQKKSAEERIKNDGYDEDDD